MNLVVLTGRLTKENKLEYTPNGKEVLKNSIAVRRDFKNEGGEYETDFINVVVFGQAANYLNQYTTKGDLIEVTGRWQIRNYQDNEGKTRYINECIVNSASKLVGSQNQAQNQPQEAPQQQFQAAQQFNQQASSDPFAETKYYEDEGGTYYYNAQGQKEYIGF